MCAAVVGVTDFVRHFSTLSQGMATFLLFAFLIVQVANGQFTTTPRNLVGFVGETAFFACAGNQIGWDVYYHGATNATAISANGILINDSSKYRFQEDKLYIYNLDMKDAGTYRCKYIPLPSVYKEAKLVILESRPNCTMNLTKEAAAEGDYVRMTCEVTYSGKWAPTPTLRWDNRRYDRRLYRTTSNIVVRAENATEGNRLTATQVIELTPTNNRGYFRCGVFFETLGISTSCETERFYVYYGPRSLSVTSRDGLYSPGSKIEVSADSNPSPPGYKWVDTATGKTVARGRILTITDDMIGRKTLKVVACNTILVPPFPEKCAELTLTITSTGITIVTTTKATETTPATGRFTWRPMRFMTKAFFPDFITTTASTAPPFIGKPSTTDVLDGGDRTVLIIVGTILACVAVSGVTTIVVLFVRVRRLTATVNAMTATGTKTGTY